jgi:hypothetical protein
LQIADCRLSCDLLGFGRMLAQVTLAASAPSPDRPDLSERLAKLMLLVLAAGIVWGTAVGAVRILAALIRWADL